LPENSNANGHNSIENKWKGVKKGLAVICYIQLLSMAGITILTPVNHNIVM